AVLLGVMLMKLILPPAPRPAASAIPEEPPDETLRVTHPDGFSIVRPRNWKGKVLGKGPDPQYPAIQLSLSEGRAAKGVARLDVLQLREEPKFGDQAPHIQFQGRPARLTAERQPAVPLDSPGELTASIAFERDGAWWLITYYLFRDRDSVPEM